MDPSYPGPVTAPQVTSTVQQRKAVTADQEAWLTDRLRTLISMSGALFQLRRVGADLRLMDGGIDGLVNGAAIKIIDLLGLQPAYENPWKIGQRPSRG